MINLKYSPLALVVAGALYSVSALAADPVSATTNLVPTASTTVTAVQAPSQGENASSAQAAAAAQPRAPEKPVTDKPSGTTPTVSQQEGTVNPGAVAVAKPSADVTPSAQAATVGKAAADSSVVSTPAPDAVKATVNTAPAFTPEQEARIGEVAKEYLLAHPEFLLDVGQKLQAQQREQQLHAMTATVLAHQDALLNDPATPSYGPADAKVALVEFFDYQCSVCAQQAPVLQALMQANPQVRYVFKEWPIFGARWPASMDAAETGLQIWRQKGADAYLAYHNAIYATGHNEGKLTPQDISHLAAKAGKLKGKKAEMLDTLAQTDALAQNLGLRGTPGLIVMPSSGATADNVTVVPGGASQEVLLAAIAKATTR